MTEWIYDYLRPALSIAGMTVWSYLMIDGRQLAPTTTLALLFLILACAGLGHYISDITGRGGGNDE